MIRLDKIGADSHIVSVKLATDMKQGNVVKLNGLVEGEREIYNAVAPAAATDKIVVLTTPFHPYSTSEDERTFTLKAGKPQRGHYLTSGDVITVTEDLIQGAATKGQFVVIQTSETLKASATAVESSVVFAVDDIENSVPEFFGTKGVVLRVL